ncbi:MAG: hypothetical protein EBR93_05735, partial [Bacteroidetes bacterium]|nr:hypothetical protein [Bacteroidota bacterium]
MHSGISRHEIMKRLGIMLQEDLACSSCLRRLGNWCLSNGVTFKEDGVSIKRELSVVLQRAYVTFLRQSLIVMYMCGFVPWIITRENGIPVPKVVPIGSFAWSVEMDDEEDEYAFDPTSGKVGETKNGAKTTGQRKRKRKVGMPYYKIHMINTEINTDNVHITNFVEPSLLSSNDVATPIWAIYERNCMLQEVRQLLRMTTIHNQCKHVMISEEVELKNPNTAGIQLLDEFRRYAISGAHNTLLTSAMTRLRARDNTHLESVN